MHLAMLTVLNCKKADAYCIHPYLSTFSHHPNAASQLRAVSFPDIKPVTDRLTAICGDFTQAYRHLDPSQTFDTVVTCFFLDTAFDIIEYLTTIHRCLKPGGLFINIGPLLYSGQPRLELNLEELLLLVETVGFRITKREMVDTDYTQNHGSMVRSRLLSLLRSMAELMMRS